MDEIPPQRAAVAVMRNDPVHFSLIAEVDAGSGDPHPTPDLAELASTAPTIRFLQQAFEWEHMAWVFYPYFWGRRSQWEHTVTATHTDPDFAAFLNSGAARLSISVRPGFEGLVKHFMETGEVYPDGMPAIGDPGYVSFINEQMTVLGAPGDEVAWPPDAPREWDIVAPTPLVLVRTSTEARLPSWDPDTGQEQG